MESIDILIEEGSGQVIEVSVMLFVILYGLDVVVIFEPGFHM